jgi:hypothetical protein
MKGTIVLGNENQNTSGSNKYKSGIGKKDETSVKKVDEF